MNNGVPHIEYPTGHMDLIVRNFFWEADMRRTRKVLRLAKDYCTDTQRHALISSLQKECKFIQDALGEMNNMEQRLGDLIAPFGFIDPKKRLSRRIEKCKREVDELTKARWRS